MSAGLTQKQADCLDAIKRLTVDGVSPSFEELRVDLGYASRHRIWDMLNALEERGHIRRLRNRARAIEVIEGDEPGAAVMQALHDLSPETLRRVIAHASGILAHKTGGGKRVGPSTTSAEPLGGCGR